MNSVEKFMYYFVTITIRLALIIVILAIIPTAAILATWNTVPGEKLYPLKRNIEVTVLKLFTGNFAMTADLQSQILDQRFNESQVLLANSSDGDSLTTLSSQVVAAKTEIVRAAYVDKSSAVVQTKAEKLVVQLNEYNHKLEDTKTKIINNEPIVATKTSAPIIVQQIVQTPTNPPVVSVQKTQVDTKPIVKVEAKAAAAENIVKVEQAQEEIKAAIVELQQVVQAEKEKNKEENKNQKNNGQENKESKDTNENSDNNNNNENKEEKNNKKD